MSDDEEEKKTIFVSDLDVRVKVMKNLRAACPGESDDEILSRLQAMTPAAIQKIADQVLLASVFGGLVDASKKEEER